jgi:NTE family protein
MAEDLRDGEWPYADGEWPHKPFTLVLAGGGARGFSHAGVLRALEGYGMQPAALVGVSMGALVAAAYALNPDWYAAILSTEPRSLPGPHFSPAGNGKAGPLEKLSRAWEVGKDVWRMAEGWGIAEDRLSPASGLLRSLVRDGDLDGGRVPVAVCATDLRSGERVVLRSGSAAEAVYASSALAGLLAPLVKGERVLVDGAYADLAPIDVARSFGAPVVIAVDPGQNHFDARVGNGLQALVRALEICHRRHADLRFADADMVLRPPFRRPIDVLDLKAQRECVAAGLRAVRLERERLRDILGGPPGPVRPRRRHSAEAEA